MGAPTSSAASRSSSAPRARGCGRSSAGRCDALVSIPLAGAVESLNVSVAAAVLLYEAPPAAPRGLMAEPTLYLFDGYNLLHAGPFADRRELVDALASFVATRGRARRRRLRRRRRRRRARAARRCASRRTPTRCSSGSRPSTASASGCCSSPRTRPCSARPGVRWRSSPRRRSSATSSRRERRDAPPGGLADKLDDGDARAARTAPPRASASRACGSRASRACLFWTVLARFTST